MPSKRYFERVNLDKADRMPQGYLRAPARLTRTGVLIYRNKDGSVVRQLRHPDEVFNPDSYGTLAGVPLTNEHPNGLLDSSNTKSKLIGWVADEVQPEDIYLKSAITIVDDDCITAVENGKQELSCGYTSDLVEEAGIYNGEAYDVKQTNIVYNHLALVKKGRAGENVRVLLDSEFELIEDSTEGEKEMGKIKIGEKEYDASPELCDAINSMKSQFDSEKKALNDKMAVMVPASTAAALPEQDPAKISAHADAMQAQVDALKAENAQLKTKMDGAADETFKKAVTARVALEKHAEKVVKEFKFDGKSDLEIMKEVVVAKFPGTSLDGKSEVYVQARYDHACEVMNEDAANIEKLKDTNRNRTDRTEVPSMEEARAKMIADAKDAWKTPSETARK